MLAASWFKIGMAPIACATPEDDPLLQQAVGKGLMRTPKGHTSYSLCEEFLACLYPHIMDAVKRHHSSAIDETPIEFVFSAPAEWGDEYKAKLRNAATAAGFATRMGDKISMIDEPEAAALLTFECYKKSTQIDSVFKVCGYLTAMPIIKRES